MAVVPRMNAKSDGSIDAAYTRIHEAQRPDDRTRVRRVLTARDKAVLLGPVTGLCAINPAPNVHGGL